MNTKRGEPQGTRLRTTAGGMRHCAYPPSALVVATQAAEALPRDRESPEAVVVAEQVAEASPLTVDRPSALVVATQAAEASPRDRESPEAVAVAEQVAEASPGG